MSINYEVIAVYSQLLHTMQAVLCQEQRRTMGLYTWRRWQWYGQVPIFTTISIYRHCVTVYTDHSEVKDVLERGSPSGRHARWWTRVFTVEE